MNALDIETYRHSCAHLMAHAVKTLYPSAQVTIGPVTEFGFFYDFYYPENFSEKDLTTIENKMREIAKKDIPIKREVLPRNEAIAYFKDKNEHFKCEIIASIPEEEEISLYRQGDFVDLCRGPHAEDTGQLTAFKLLKVSGSYWKGDQNNPSLQRIYGTAWLSKQELTDYLTLLKESEKRDHRIIGKQLGYFHFQEQAPGMPYWHPSGWTIYQIITSYLRSKLKKSNYQEIATPLLADQELWEASGHWDKFGNHMFTTKSENRNYAIKPMNCPNHVQIYKQQLRSYKDLPIRFSEFGSCHRNEYSGTLHGLLRVRAFVQDDAHIFCTKEQIATETKNFITLLQGVYRDFGFTTIEYALSTRPEKRVGSDELWDSSETILANTLNEIGVDWKENKGEGAFYGPKIEFILEDCLKRKWQCGTIQCDFSMPERLGATYVDENSAKQTPVMIHRAIVGSLERFIGVLIEHYAGALPLWLAPTQCVILTVNENCVAEAEKNISWLQKHGIRVTLDQRNEKIGLKIRENSLKKIPYLLILGEKELETGLLAIRKRKVGDQGSVKPEVFLDTLLSEIHSKI